MVSLWYSNDAPPADLSAVEPIELLKGSAALHFGAAEQGGVINYIYKAPQAESEYEIETIIDSEGKRAWNFNATGALNKSGNWLWRCAL